MQRRRYCRNILHYWPFRRLSHAQFPIAQLLLCALHGDRPYVATGVAPVGIHTNSDNVNFDVRSRVTVSRYYFCSAYRSHWATAAYS